MMTPMFLNHKNTEYFDLNQDHSHEDQQQQVLESSPFYPPSFGVSNISSLHLQQGLGMSATHCISEQSLAFDQLEGSKNMFLDMVSPTYGAHQMTSTNNYGSQDHKIFIFKQREDDDQVTNNQNKSESTATDTNGSSDLRWMSSKMRMMRRMTNSNDTKTGSRNGSRIIMSSNNNTDHHSPQLNVVVTSDKNIDTNNYGIRVCSDCNTTKTPLWRSGPQGPKTLCNACGIRQRKARKAAMEAAAAAAATNSSCEAAAASSSTSSKTKIKLKINNKEKNKSRATNNNTCVSQHINKKQTTYNKQQTNNQLVESDHTNNSSTSNTSSKRQMFFEEFAVKLLSKNAAFHRMFPQDEEEGALLLMTLSYDDFNES